MSIDNTRMNIFLFAIIVIYPWLFHVFQGLYIPELGYWLVNYENFFTNFLNVPQATSCWFTLFMGAIVDYLIGSWGVVGFRIANVFVLYLLLYFIYKILEGYTTKTKLLFALLTAEISVNSYDFINYYTLTTLFFISASFYMYNGLKKDNQMYLFISGFFLGINIFVRFPNIVGIGFLLAIFYFHFGQSNISYKKMFKQSFIVLFGWIVSILITFIIMKLMGHYEIYTKNIIDLLTMTQEKSAYGGDRIIYKYILAQIYAVKYSLFIFSGIAILFFLQKINIKNKILKNLYWLFILCVSTFILIKLSGIAHSNYFPVYNGIIGFLYIFLLWIIIRQFSKNINYGVIALLALLTFEMIPFGSATILHQAKFGLYMVIPVVFVYLFSAEDIKTKYISIKQSAMEQLTYMSGGILIIYFMIGITIYHPPSLETDRWKMIYTVNDPRLKANFMTKDKAKTLEELTHAMSIHTNNLSYILTYGRISTINYLSNLKPYLNNTYPGFMTIQKLEIELALEEKSKTLPMIVRSKTLTTAKGWPKVSIKKDGISKEMRIIFYHFIDKYNYKLVWENNDFQILVPEL